MQEREARKQGMMTTDQWGEYCGVVDDWHPEKGKPQGQKSAPGAEEDIAEQCYAARPGARHESVKKISPPPGKGSSEGWGSLRTGHEELLGKVPDPVEGNELERRECKMGERKNGGVSVSMKRNRDARRAARMAKVPSGPERKNP